MFFVCPINDNSYVIILATGIASGTFSHLNEVVFATEAHQLIVNCKERPVFLAPLSWRGKSCVHGRCFLLYILIRRTSASAFPTAVSLSSIIRERPQNYNNYIQAFHKKDGIHGHEVRNCLTRRTVRQPPSRITRAEGVGRVIFFGKTGKVGFCRFWLSPLHFQEEAGMGFLKGPLFPHNP